MCKVEQLQLLRILQLRPIVNKSNLGNFILSNLSDKLSYYRIPKEKITILRA